MSDKPCSILGRLFHLLWALVSGFLKLIVIVVVIAGFALTWLALRGGHGVSVENNEPLVVAPTGQLVDQVDEDPGARLLQNVNAGAAQFPDAIKKLPEGGGSLQVRAIAILVTLILVGWAIWQSKRTAAFEEPAPGGGVPAPAAK